MIEAPPLMFVVERQEKHGFPDIRAVYTSQKEARDLAEMWARVSEEDEAAFGDSDVEIIGGGQEVILSSLTLGHHFDKKIRSERVSNY